MNALGDIMEYFVLPDESMDANGRHVSPGRYALTHTKAYPSLTVARAQAIASPLFSMYRLCIYAGDEGYAELVGYVCTSLKGKDIYHYSRANVYMDRTGKMWYLNKDGTLGNRYYKKK